MNYANKKYKNQIFKYTPVYKQNELKKVHKDEVLALLGTDFKEIVENLTSNVDGIYGFYLPKPQYLTTDYLAAIAKGRQKALRNNELFEPTIPKHKFYYLDYLKAEICKHIEVLEYFPERYRRTEEEKGNLIMEDKDFMYTVFATVAPQKFQAFCKQQDDLHTAYKQSLDPDYMDMPEWLYVKLKKKKTPNSNKGKAGKMIVYKARSKRLKRKREEIMKHQVEQKVVKDTVWFPSEQHQTQPEEPSMFHKYVDINEYKKMRNDQHKLSSQAQMYIDQVTRAPWVAAAAMSNEKDARIEYDRVRDSLMKTLSSFNPNIPTFEYACNQSKLNNNNTQVN